MNERKKEMQVADSVSLAEDGWVILILLLLVEMYV